MINQTYLVDRNEFDSQLKKDLKLRLNKMRERTKSLLEKHNWKKYFKNEESMDISKVKSNSKTSLVALFKMDDINIDNSKIQPFTKSKNLKLIKYKKTFTFYS